MPLVLMSTFYARAIQHFGGHRGAWSHMPLFSTFIRLMYFGCPFILVFRHFFVDPLYVEFSGIFVGLAIADALHTFFDWATGELNFWGRAGAKSKLLSWWVKYQFDFPSDEILRKRKNKIGHRGHYYEEEN